MLNYQQYGLIEETQQGFSHIWGKFMGHNGSLTLGLLALAYRNPSVTRRRLWGWLCQH